MNEGGSSSSGTPWPESKRRSTSNDMEETTKRLRISDTKEIVHDMAVDCDMSSKEIAAFAKSIMSLSKQKEEEEALAKVACSFIKSGKGYRLAGECYICLQPLLDDIESPSFGVTSYKCNCSKNQLVHVKCVTSLISSSGKCGSCDTHIRIATTRVASFERVFPTFRVVRRDEEFDVFDLEDDEE